jgi:hypothetical protein
VHHINILLRVDDSLKREVNKLELENLREVRSVAMNDGPRAHRNMDDLTLENAYSVFIGSNDSSFFVSPGSLFFSAY